MSNKRKAPITARSYEQHVQVKIVNPYFDGRYRESKSNPRQITATINCKESPAAYWRYHNKITEAQYRVAVDIRRWFEIMGGAGAGAIDYSKVKVDTSITSDPITLRHLAASRKLRHVEETLNDKELYKAFLSVCAAEERLKDLWPSSRKRAKMVEAVQWALEVLSEEFGYKTTKAA